LMYLSLKFTAPPDSVTVSIRTGIPGLRRLVRVRAAGAGASEALSRPPRLPSPRSLNVQRAFGFTMIRE